MLGNPKPWDVIVTPTRLSLAVETPNILPKQAALDLLLLNSSPLDGTELQEANAVLNLAIQAAEDVVSPIKRYTKRITRAFELT